MLHQLLWSLIRQQYKEWDFILVDDSDEPVQWDKIGVYPRLFSEMQRTGHGIRIISGPRVSRIGAAYQAGFSAADTDNPLFFRVDDDAWLEPDYLSRLAAIMTDDSVGACGGLFLHPGAEIQTLQVSDPRYKYAAIENVSDQINVQWYRHEKKSPIPVEHLTANILFSRKWLETIGGFEALLFSQHRNETQATWRLHVEGAKLFVDPEAVAWHLRGANGGARKVHPDVFIKDHRKFMAQRRSMTPGIHISLGHAIGDGLMATPMLHVMRRMNPERNISVFASWAPAVLKNSPDVDEIAQHPLDAQRTVRLEQSVYAWAGANQWKGHLAEAHCLMFNVPLPDDMIPRLYFGQDEPTGKVPIDPFMVIAPWSSARTLDFFQPSGNKNWPLDRWLAVVEWAHKKGLKVVQLRGAEDEPLIEGIDLDLCAKPLREAFACIARAKVLVSVDTMAHHAAAACGVPSVVLWGRSKPEHFGYKKDNIINMQGECPGIQVKQQISVQGTEPYFVWVTRDRPCINGDQWAMDKEVCPIEGHPCMSGISVNAVLDALESLWKGGSLKTQ